MNMVARKPARNGNSILGKLKIADETPDKTQGKDSISKFLEALDKQIDFVGLEIEKKPLPMQGGTERTRKPNLWYFQKKGKFYVSVRYGTILMDMTGDNKVLEIDNLEEYSETAQPTVYAGTTLKDVQDTLKTIRNAVEAGELKPFIQHVASMISDRLSKGRK
jgi:protein associated with RNAse G/E